MISEKSQFNRAITHKIQTSNSCKESGCLESDKGCHCTKITKSEVEYVDMSVLTRLVWESFNSTENKKMHDRNNTITSIFYGGRDTDEYCIHRILSKLKMYRKDIWNINIAEGYYGEVVDSITLKSEFIQSINDHVQRILNYDTLKEKLEYCLMVEYGRVLDILCDKDYQQVWTNYNGIEFMDSNRLHINRITFEDLKHYKKDSYKLNRGIVKKIGNKYYIIDGFHRILAMKDDPEAPFCVYEVVDRPEFALKNPILY